MMCMWWGTPYKAYVIEDSPKKKKKDEEENMEYYMVQPGDQFVPIGHNGQIAIQPQQPQPAAVAQPQVQNWVGCAVPAAAAVQQQQPQQWFAPTPQQLHAQNVAAAQVNGANVPRQLVPYNPPAGQALWVHNLDGSWSLRTVTDIQNKLNGRWHNSISGYPYFQVQAKSGS